MSHFAPINDLWIAEVSDDNATYVYAIRARSEHAAQEKLHILLRKEWPEEMAKRDESERRLHSTIHQYFLHEDVTCIA